MIFGGEISFLGSKLIFSNFFFQILLNEAKTHPNHMDSEVQQTSPKYSLPLFSTKKKLNNEEKHTSLQKKNNLNIFKIIASIDFILSL